jgi:RNA polymerase sigma factor (sigma-70 family)
VTPRLLIEPARLAGRSLLRVQTDERLVDLVRAGNDRAFEAIVERYRRPLLRYCARLLPPARAEDAVQQAFLNAFAALRRDGAAIELRPWLYRIAHNAALNALRETGWGHEDVEAAAPAHEGPHEVAERRDSLRAVLDAVGTLPARQRDAMILRELEGRSYAQIAAELEVSGGAVRQLLNRARNTLREQADAALAGAR